MCSFDKELNRFVPFGQNRTVAREEQDILEKDTWASDPGNSDHEGESKDPPAGHFAVVLD